MAEGECEDCGGEIRIRTWSAGDEIYVEEDCLRCGLTSCYGDM
jgi:hypothetical protein